MVWTPQVPADLPKAGNVMLSRRYEFVLFPPLPQQFALQRRRVYVPWEMVEGWKSLAVVSLVGSTICVHLQDRVRVYDATTGSVYWHLIFNWRANNSFSKYPFNLLVHVAAWSMAIEITLLPKFEVSLGMNNESLGHGRGEPHVSQQPSLACDYCCMYLLCHPFFLSSRPDAPHTF